MPIDIYRYAKMFLQVAIQFFRAKQYPPAGFVSILHELASKIVWQSVSSQPPLREHRLGSSEH